MGNGYVVIMDHTFDPETKVTIFGSRPQAEAYLHWAWEDYYNTEIAENPDGISEDETYHEDDYAVITYTDGTMTEFRVLEGEEISEDYNKNWKRYINEHYEGR